jgi:hypothetical protein|tara:strand:+ start:1003 stop:1698 length:696 start_codon:yes stop_codon:yes gene_type:complete
MLPKLDVPNYELEVPSTDEKLKFRPFLVKEEKVLLIALESQDTKEMLRAMKEIIATCTYEKFDVDSAPLFDLEYVFLKIRSKSIGETSTIRVKCEDGVNYAQVEIPLEDINVEVDENHTNKIVINKDISVIMDYPRVDIENYIIEGQEVVSFFKVIKQCIYQVIDGETVHEKTDMEDKDLDDFLGGLTNAHLNKFKTFFDTMPKLKYEVKYKHPKEDKFETKVLEGMNSFF